MHLNITKLLLLLSCGTLYATYLPKIEILSSKLDETNIDASYTLDIIDTQKIDTFHVSSIEDLSSVVSNVNISGIGNRNNKTFTFRGISNYVAYESSVAMYVDDVPIPFSYGYGAVDFHNIESIEVLKGPQGTEFGKGAESGVINIYTYGPTNTFESEASIGFASYNTKEMYSRVSGPTSNKDLTYLFSVTKNSSDGYTTNNNTGAHFDRKDFLGFSTKFRYKPSSKLNIAFNYTKSIIDDGGSPFKANTKENPYSISNEPYDDSLKMNNDLVSLVINYTDQNYKFTSISSYAKETIIEDNYLSILSGLLINTQIDIQEFTQEFRLNYNFENMDLLVGTFYSNKFSFDYKENQTLTALNINSLNDLQNPDENIALFTQMKYYIDDNYTFLVGLRYQQTKRSFTRSLNNFAAPTTGVSSETTWTHILPKVSLSYLAQDDSNTYLTYAEGYRPGGYNYRSNDTLVPFKPETTHSFELGHKRLVNPSLTFNSAIFYNIIKNLRINTFSDTLSSTTLNAKEAYSYGAEFDIQYKNKNLNIYSTLGLIKAKYKDLDSQSNYNGNTIIDVPDITASLGAKYNFHKDYHIQSDIKYMGERYYNVSNTAKENAYSVVNLGLGYQKDAWSALIYADNIFDKEYVDFMIYTPSNNYYHFAPPMLIGLKLTKKF